MKRLLWNIAEGAWQRRIALWTSWPWPASPELGRWHWGAALEWQPRDLWVGVSFHGGRDPGFGARWDAYVCPLPTLVVHVYAFFEWYEVPF